MSHAARMRVGSAGRVLCACLLLTACGAEQEQVRVAAPSALAAASPSPSAAVEYESPAAVSEPSPSGPSAMPSEAAPAPSAAPEAPPSAAPQPPAAASPKPDYGAALWNTSWRAEERTRSGQAQPFARGQGWEVNFNRTPRQVLGWRAACNSSGGDLDVAAKRLMVEDGTVASTAVGCDEARLAEDREATAFFIADPSWSLTGDTLLLTSGDTVLRLVRAGG